MWGIESETSGGDTDPGDYCTTTGWGGVTTTVAWVGIRAAFGKPSMEAILSCRVPRKLNTIWYTTSKLKTGGESASEELSVKDGKREKEIMST